MRNPSVYLNPGHDKSYDSGVVSGANRECDIVYDIALYCRSFLHRNGCIVHLDQHNGLENICYQANILSSDIFVSIHLNGAEGYARGTETLVYSCDKNSLCYMLGGFINTRVLDYFLLRDRSWVNRGVKERPSLIVLNSTSMPAALVEVGFLTDSQDTLYILSDKCGVGEAIGKGILDYWRWYSEPYQIKA